MPSDLPATDTAGSPWEGSWEGTGGGAVQRGRDAERHKEAAAAALTGPRGGQCNGGSQTWTTDGPVKRHYYSSWKNLVWRQHSSFQA